MEAESKTTVTVAPTGDVGTATSVSGDGRAAATPSVDGQALGFAMPDPVLHERTSPSGFLFDALRFRRNGRRVASVLVALLFLSGGGLFSFPFFTDLYTHQVVQDRLENQFSAAAAAPQSVEQWQATVERGKPITRMVIPKIGLDTIVVEGTSPDALRAGAGHYPNTPLPGQKGNVAIAGHRTTYGHPFNRIDELTKGDQIWLITPVGDYLYVVADPAPGWPSNPNVVAPNDWTVIAPTPEPSLTMTSCHPKGSAESRIVVRSRLTGSYSPGTYKPEGGAPAPQAPVPQKAA